MLLKNEFASKAYTKIVLKEMQHEKVCVCVRVYDLMGNLHQLGNSKVTNVSLVF